MTIYEMALYFIFYSILGWLIEVCYMTLELGEFQNRGFLNGPICPIYGFGVLLVMVALTPLQDNIIILFWGSLFLCTSLELLVGIGLQKIYHNKWWDYSHEKYNFHGYICLKISILWGISCVVMMKVIQPLVANLVDYIPAIVGNVIIIVSCSLIALDLVVSLCVVNNLNIRLKEIEEISRKLKISSNAIGTNISDEVLELKAKYDKLIEQKKYAQERVIKAFPTMKSQNYARALDTLKQKLKIKK